MVRGKRNSYGGRSFPEILYEVVNDPWTDSIVSWSQSGKSFIVWNESEFIRDFLPRFFQLKQLSSFIIRLYTYGFTKVESEQWEYANDCFVRGKPELTAPQSFVFTRSPELLRIMERQKKRVLAIRKDRVHVQQFVAQINQI